MRLLADSSLHGRVVQALAAAGHDVDDVRRWPADPGDSAILERARLDGRILVTADTDFGELAVRRGMQHAGVVIIAQDMTSQTQAAACVALLDGTVPLEPNGLVRVTAGGIRRR